MSHNCNNFTDTLANFLLGKGIPSHIINMPQAVMQSPMGRMLLPQLMQGVNATRQNGSILGLQQTAQSSPKNAVKNVTDSADLAQLLEEAKFKCAVIFFTSATCPPCKTVYPLYDQLAEEFGDKATLIKVDISKPQVQGITNQFSVRSTPTFITFLKGEQENTWVGADPAKLRGNLQLLVQMAFPSHPHSRLKAPSFFSADRKPVIYAKVPPLEKLMTKMGPDLASQAEIGVLKSYLESRGKEGPQGAILPNMGILSNFIQKIMADLPPERLFAVVDLFRCALSDLRVSGYYAEERGFETIQAVLKVVVNSTETVPYALRLVTLQLGCNLFSSPLFPHEILRADDLRALIIQLVSSSFLDESHNNVRVAAASLLYNLALANRKARQENKPNLPDADQIELGASVVEAIDQEKESAEALQGMLSALGHLFYGSDVEGELADLLRALDAEDTVLAKKSMFKNEKLIIEVGHELLGEGLRKP